MDRPSIDEIYMGMALLLAKRSTCSRLQVGTVITDKYKLKVLGSGYNGNAKGLPNKCDYNTPGLCGDIHSEQNALLIAGSNDKEKIVYVTSSPCEMCCKLMINSGTSKVIFKEKYRKGKHLKWLINSKIELWQLKEKKLIRIRKKDLW